MNLNSLNIKATLGVMMVCIVGLCASPAQAATITVTANAADVLNGANGSCALREAIQNMNDAADTYADCANTGAGYGASDTINLPAGIYTNAIGGVGELLNANRSLDILQSVTITGAGAGSSIIDGGGAGIADKVVYIAPGITVSISGVTIQNGKVAGNAGGILNNGTLTVTNSTISGNTATNNGGGITNTGTLTVTNSTISGNSVTNFGAAGGGGIFNNNTFTVTNTTISGNTVNGWGGGILNGGTLTVTNTTISGNTAVSNLGGGIFSNGAVTVINSTITKNSGTGIYRNAGSVTLSNSIIANQAADWDCSNGSFTSNGHNLDSDGGCGLAGAGDISNSAAANLGALASNGGLTQTHALLAGSAAIDAGDNTICAAAPVSNASQNGITRPSDGDGNGTATCDIGAYEAPDTTPDAFSFTAQTGVALSTLATSNTITVAGINTVSPISIVGGTYSVNGGAYTAVAGTVSNGGTVTVQQTSSASFGTLTTSTLTIGGVAGTFDVTTLAQDTTPAAFTFTAQTGVALSSVATSNTITVAGINSAANISIAGGSYSINGGAYTSAAGTVNNGNTVTLRQTSSASFSATTTATLTIGGVSGAFAVTTLAVTTSYTAPSATGTGNIAASFTGGAGCGYTVAQFIPLTGHAASPPAGSAPAGVSFPHGLFDFTAASCLIQGATLAFTITYPQALPPGAVYWKYGPAPGNAVPHWYQLPAVIAGNTATFSITDGGLGDDDLAANGTIVDQGGPGVPGGGASGIPTLSEWGLILLAGMLGVFGVVGMRRRAVL